MIKIGYQFATHPQFPPIMANFESVCTTKFVWWLVQYTLTMNGTFWYFNCIMTLILTPWNTLTPLAPNYVTNSKTIVSQIKPPYKTMASTTILFKLSKMSPSTTITRITTKEWTLWIFHHICMNENPILFIHGCNFITQKGNKSNSLEQILGLIQH